MKTVRVNNKRKNCPFAAGKLHPKYIDYKNHRFLRKYTTEMGSIVPSRITGISNIFQHDISREIKYARFLALLPYCDRH
jgi:small subunit ribosomal protein S18